MKKVCYLDNAFLETDNYDFQNFYKGFCFKNYWDTGEHNVTVGLFIYDHETLDIPNPDYDYIIIVNNRPFAEYFNTDYKQVRLHNDYVYINIYCKKNTWLYKYIDNDLFPRSKDFSQIQESITKEDLNDFQFGHRISLAIHEAAIADDYFKQRRAAEV